MVRPGDFGFVLSWPELALKVGEEEKKWRNISAKIYNAVRMSVFTQCELPCVLELNGNNATYCKNTLASIETSIKLCVSIDWIQHLSSSAGKQLKLSKNCTSINENKTKSHSIVR